MEYYVYNNLYKCYEKFRFSQIGILFDLITGDKINLCKSLTEKCWKVWQQLLQYYTIIFLKNHISGEHQCKIKTY